jgi:hypothetical protein
MAPIRQRRARRVRVNCVCHVVPCVGPRCRSRLRVHCKGNYAPGSPDSDTHMAPNDCEY